MAWSLVHSKCSTSLAKVIHAEQSGGCGYVGMAQLLRFLFVFILSFAITSMCMQQILVAWEFILWPKILRTRTLKITINFREDNRQFMKIITLKEREREKLL